MRIVEPTLGGRPLPAAGVGGGELGGGGGGEEAEIEPVSGVRPPGHRRRLLGSRRRRFRRNLLRLPHLGIGPASEVVNGAPKLPGPNLSGCEIFARLCLNSKSGYNLEAFCRAGGRLGGVRGIGHRNSNRV